MLSVEFRVEFTCTWIRPLAPQYIGIVMMCLFTGILHHALLAIFPDNNFTGILHNEMHAIFPGKRDDYTKSTKDWVIL